MSDVTAEFRLGLIKDLHNARSEADIEAVPSWRDIAFLLNLIGELEYEYAIQRKVLGGSEPPSIVGDWWSTRDEVNEGLLDITTEWAEYTLVRRRKAGPVEVVDS